MPITSLDALLRRAAERWGDEPFLVGGLPSPGGTALAVDDVLDCAPTETYAAFDRRVDGLAAGLASRGAVAGSLVAAVLTSPRDLVWTWFAMARLGAVLLPINPALTTFEMRAILQMARPVAVLADGGTSEAASAALGRQAWIVDAVDHPGAAVDGRPSGDTALTVLCTSGTTGRPKGCVLTHASYTLPAEDFVRWMEVTGQDRFFNCLPLFHLAGQAFVAAAVCSGASVVMARRFSGSRFWEQVAGSGATLFRHLGEMLAVLCAQPSRPVERAHRLRAVYGGGAGAAVAERFERRFGVRVVEGYGLTETNTVLRNELRSPRAGSIGRAAPYAQVRIADDAGVERAPSEIGQIQVRRNPAMTTGYLRDPEATAESFVGAWYRTGDLGWRDQDGYYYFAGRTKDVIRRRGENIRACEIEEVLHGHPAVAVAAVIGVPDGVGGEDCKAFVVAAPAATISVDGLVRWCRSSLAGYKIPRHFEICDQLPRTPTNKVDKSRLRAVGTLGGLSVDLLVPAAGRR